MAIREVFLTDADIELVRNMLDDREEAIAKTMSNAPALSITSALHEVASLRKALDTQELF